MPTVLLLRGKTATTIKGLDSDSSTADPAAADPYEHAFAAQGYRAVFLPVLEHALTNVDALEPVLRAGPHGFYWGIVVTSQRAVEALKVAWEACCDDTAFLISPTARSWLGLPLFAVGDATARAAAALGFTPLASSSGTAAVLADEIIAYHARLADMATHPARSSLDGALLFLTGDKRRDVLPAKLRAAEIRVEEMMMYRTQGVGGFDAALKRCLEEDVGGEGRFDWVVFFSPSGVDVALEQLKALTFRDEVRVAVIGSTTGDHFALKVGVGEADVVAERPDAESVVKGVVEFDRNREREVFYL